MRRMLGDHVRTESEMNMVDAVGFSPTLRLLRLAAELKQARTRTGLTSEEAEQRLEWGRGKISRMENAQTKRPRVTDVQLILNVYGVDDEQYRETLYDLARDARKRGWWTRFGSDVFTGMFVDYETEATEIRTFESVFVPGLLQTPEYAAELARAGLIRDERLIERRVAARMQRQQLLAQESPPDYWAIIDESALRRDVGGTELMRAQLELIVEVAGSGAVNVQVVRASAHAGMAGPFVILDFPDEVHPSIVYLETATDGLYLERLDEIRYYERIFNSLRSTAPGPSDSIACIRDIIDNM